MQKNENAKKASKSIIEILYLQPCAPYFACRDVTKLLEELPMQTTKEMAINMFLLGYIHGKRAERARRKK